MTELSDARTTIRLPNDLALDLSAEARLRLLIRVMCELVAYGEDDTIDLNLEREASARRANETAASRPVGRASRPSASGSPHRSRAVGSAFASSEASGKVTVCSGRSSLAGSYSSERAINRHSTRMITRRF